MRIAVIGAGVAGLSCADGLVAAGHEVELFDKGRRPGGRMSTRRIELDGRTFCFDHGAQYFTARDTAFKSRVAEWERAGVVARWPAAGEDAWVGTPGMSAPVEALADAHRVAWAVRVEAIECEADRWRLIGAADETLFDAVVVAVPAEQAEPLLAPHHSAFAALARQARSAPCWTAMMAFAEPVGASRTIIRRAGAIGWAARDGDKPGRANSETWVVQGSPDWSAEHLEEAREPVAAALLAELSKALEVDLPAPIYLSAHRWRYAKSGDAGGPGALWAAADRVGACGDWLLAPRVEGAWLSGALLAGMIG